MRRRVLLRRFLSKGPIATDNTDYRKPTSELDLVAIAFNEPWVIRHQIRLLRKHLRDPFTYSVVDNSSSTDTRAIIRDICKEQDVPYLGLPKNPFTGDPSSSHGAALTWAYRNYLKPRGAPYFGFLDHDVFPTKPTTIVDRLHGRAVYGVLQQRERKWYLWPGFAFFERECVRVDLSLMPSPGLDTGGAAWESLYSHLDKERLYPLYCRLESLRGDGPIEVVQADSVAWFEDWLHLLNASRWLDVPGREAALDEELLESL